MIEQVNDVFNLEKIYSRIFRSADPFSRAGQPNLPSTVVIYPTNGYYLTKLQFDAMMYANKTIGSSEFFVSQVEHSYHNPFVEGEHWKCVNPSFEEYYEISIGLENAVYSTSASWGILISHEDHALLVSNLEFWEAFKSRYPDWGKDYFTFLENWKNLNVDNSWLEDFLAGLTVKP